MNSTISCTFARQKEVSQLVGWYFEPSQPQRIITSRLKTMFNLSAIYSARKSPNHKLSINHKINPDTNLHKTKHTCTHIKHKMSQFFFYRSPSPIHSPRGSLGHHRWLHNQFPPFFSLLHCPGTRRTPGLCTPRCLPTCFSVRLVKRQITFI